MEAKSRIEKIVDLVLSQSPRLAYHNKCHAFDVYNAVSRYAASENLGRKDCAVLEPAALLHDIIYVPGRLDNEERSAAYALKVLPTLGYSIKEAKEVADLIPITKCPSTPSTLAEMILVDSDYDNIGRQDFFELNEAVRKEAGFEDREKWLKCSIALLENHRYYTQSAKRLRELGRTENLKKLYQMVNHG